MNFSIKNKTLRRQLSSNKQNKNSRDNILQILMKQQQQIQKNKQNINQHIKQTLSKIQFLGFDKDKSQIYAFYHYQFKNNQKENIKLAIISLLSKQNNIHNNNLQKLIFQTNKKQQKNNQPQSITLIFFNKSNNKQNSDQITFNTIKCILKQLPLKYILRINYVYIFQSPNNYLTKPTKLLTSLYSYANFNINQSKKKAYLTQKIIVQIYTLNDLVIAIGPLFYINLVHSAVLDIQNNHNYLNIYSQTNKLQSFQKNKLKINQIYQKSLYKNTFKQYKSNQQEIPIHLHLFCEVISKFQFNKSQGIFRKSYSYTQMNAIQQQLENWIDKNNIDKIKQCSADILAGCIKNFFLKTKQTLFDEQSYLIIKREKGQKNKIFLENKSNKQLSNYYKSKSQQKQSQKFLQNQIKLLIERLPQNKYIILRYLIKFLREKIIKYEKINKMTSYNLSVIFGPILLRPKQYKVQDLFYSKKISNFLQIIINNENIIN